MFCPATTPPGPVFTTCRSATPFTVVETLAVLFAPLASKGDETVALLLMLPALGGGVREMVSGECEPAFGMASVEVQVMVPPDGAPQLQPVPAPDAAVTPAGSVSTTVVVPPVVFGPLLDRKSTRLNSS